MVRQAAGRRPSPIILKKGRLRRHLSCTLRSWLRPTTEGRSNKTNPRRVAMFNLGGWEWAILLVIVLIVFGVGRLPEIGGAIGKSIREFREASKDEPKDGQAAETPAEPKEDKPA